MNQQTSFFWGIIPIVILACISTPTNIQAQDRKAQEVVDLSQVFYTTMDDISMDFTYEVVGVSSRQSLQRGTIQLKEVKYLVKMEEQETYFDTQKISVYFPQRNEYMNFSLSDWNYGNIMQMILSMYYTETVKEYHGIETLSDGSRAHKVRFNMLNSNVDYSTAYAWYDVSSYLVSRVTFLDRSKRQRSFSFSNLRYNIGLDDEIFEFNPQEYPGIVLRK